MKRFLFTVLFIFCANSVYAAGAVCVAPSPVWHWNKNGEVTATYTFAWTSDSSAGTVTCGATLINGYITRVVTNPGAAAPTADYDVVISDADGVDIMGGTMADRHTTASEHAVALANSLNHWPRVDGTIAPGVAAAGNSKTGTIVVYVQP